MQKINWPLMNDNIDSSDISDLVGFLQTMPRLTQSNEVRAFEQEWSQWLGLKHSVFVNSGSSANFLTMHALRHLKGGGEIILPPLTWVSDVASVINAGFTPVFADISWKNLAMDPKEVEKKISKKTKAVFLTHVLGLNGLSDELLSICKGNGIPLIEDTCESYGAKFGHQKLGSFGLASNFSFYFGHHMSTVEGGMISTDDPDLYECVRMLRSHGLVREVESPGYRARLIEENPDVFPEFIFALPGFNCRGTEIQARLGRSQLKKLDERNAERVRTNEIFLENLDKEKYFTAFDYAGSVNYAFILVLNPNRKDLSSARSKVTARLEALGIEFRRGLSGGGNQLRQPYLKRIAGADAHKQFPVMEFIHENSYYIGNYPGLPVDRVRWLCDELNKI